MSITFSAGYIAKIKTTAQCLYYQYARQSFFSFFHDNNVATQKIPGFWPDDSCLNQSLSITHEHEIYKSLDDEFEERITFYRYI